MHHKVIKAQIRRQLKTRYLNWHRLSKKEKKAVAKKVLDHKFSKHLNRALSINVFRLQFQIHQKLNQDILDSPSKFTIL